MGERARALQLATPPLRKAPGVKRIVADVPEHIHRQLRLVCMKRGILVRDYILQLLAKDGIR